MSLTQPSRLHGPIGVFDSGLGGLTVVRRLWEALPDEPILYVADQIHVPYGGRDLAEVSGFARGISESLLGWGCRAVVMACNISSATACNTVQAEHPDVPVCGVILPGAEAAAHRTANGRIGVLATAGTVKSGAYTAALRALNPTLHVTETACPKFVPLVEAGEIDTPEAAAAAREYLLPLLKAGVDTVILGCTHYPFLLPVLRDAAPGISYVDPALQTVCRLSDLLPAVPRAVLRDPDPTPLHVLLTTGDPGSFADQVRRFLPDAADSVQIAGCHWHNGMLVR